MADAAIGTPEPLRKGGGGLGVEGGDENGIRRNACEEPRGLAWMGRAERCPNQQRRSERKDEKANRESCDQAEAHQEARDTPGEEPIPASTARLATPTPA